MRIRWLNDAEAEVEEIYRRYENERLGLGNEFLDTLEEAVSRIETDPSSLPAEETNSTTRNVRRQRLKRFPYRVIFEPRRDAAVILAVAHASRRPGYWSRRK